MVGLAVVVGSRLAIEPAMAEQAAAPPPAAQPPVNVPGFWDPRRRPERPDLSRVKVIRFLTETDYPPFNFSAPDGSPQGFYVVLARLMCEEL
jgi:polar amino acid transport system substrate-binding protein